MSEEDYYIKSRLTVLDRILFYSFFLPLGAFVGIAGTFLLNDFDQSYEARVWGFIFIVCLIIAIVCRITFAGKVDKLRGEFYEQNKK